MIEEIWKLLGNFNQETQQAALAKCDEFEFDPDSGIVSLNESYINLIWSCNTIKEAIEKKKLIQLPITIQQELIETLEEITAHQKELLEGTDTVEELASTIEKLYANIWRYGLNHLSDELLGYQTKLNQLKDIERSAIETKIKLDEGIQSKETLDQILDTANQSKESLQTAETNANTAITNINNTLAAVEESGEKVTELLKQILEDQKNSTESLKETQASKEQADNHEQNIQELVSEFTNLKTELATNKQTQLDLFAEFESYRRKIDGLLGDANRTGMAASFTNRRRWLIVPLVAWLVIFGVSIYGLLQIGTAFIEPLLNSAIDPKAVSLTSAYWEKLPLRLALTIPLVWLGWFAAKQYGYTSRLREDYSYKEASALSFEGYKREAKEVDPEMLKKLLDQAIKNLGDNPIRIYDGHDNHGSPFQEFLEKTLKDEKAMGQLKDLFSRLKP